MPYSAVGSPYFGSSAGPTASVAINPTAVGNILVAWVVGNTTAPNDFPFASSPGSCSGGFSTPPYTSSGTLMNTCVGIVTTAGPGTLIARMFSATGTDMEVVVQEFTSDAGSAWADYPIAGGNPSFFAGTMAENPSSPTDYYISTGCACAVTGPVTVSSLTPAVGWVTIPFPTYQQGLACYYLNAGPSDSIDALSSGAKGDWMNPYVPGTTPLERLAMII